MFVDGLTATPRGNAPTGISVITLFDDPSITVVVFDPVFTT
jgi:hypothetical protein